MSYDYTDPAHAGGSIKTCHLVKTQFKAIHNVSGVSATTPVVVTSTAHGLISGTVVTITDVIGSTTYSISAATNATPIKITTTANHLLSNGYTAVISGCTGNTAANGTWTVTVTSPTQFTLDTSVGNGAYTGSGIATVPYNPANGTWTITWVSNDSFSLNSSTGSGTYVSGGRILSPATQYWTDHDIPIYTTDTTIGANPQLWTPIPLQIGSLSYQGVTASGTSMTVQNADNAMSFFVYNPLSIKMVPIDIYEAWFDPTGTTALVSGGVGHDLKHLFSGIISSGVLNRSGDQAIATYTLDLAIDQQAVVLPRRVLSTKCSVLFKGKACQYTGAVETCDRTYNTCKGLNNQANYGGFLSIPTAAK